MHSHSQTLEVQLQIELTFKHQTSQNSTFGATSTDNSLTTEGSKWRTHTQGIFSSFLKAVRWKKKQGVSVVANKRQRERGTFKGREANETVHALGLPQPLSSLWLSSRFSSVLSLLLSSFFPILSLFEVTRSIPLFFLHFFFFSEVKILIAPDRNLSEWNAFVQ